MSKFVMVDTVLSYRIRYVIELKDDESDEYALDMVTCNEALEFSQELLGENIVSHRPVTLEEAIEICDKDNPYFKTQSTERKIYNFITTIPEETEAYEYD